MPSNASLPSTAVKTVGSLIPEPHMSSLSMVMAQSPRLLRSVKPFSEPEAMAEKVAQVPEAYQVPPLTVGEVSGGW